MYKICCILTLIIFLGGSTYATSMGDQYPRYHPGQRFDRDHCEPISALVSEEVISRHVHLGIEILTDCWLGIQQSTKSRAHTLNCQSFTTFVDPLTGICSNRVEGF